MAMMEQATLTFPILASYYRKGAPFAAQLPTTPRHIGPETVPTVQPEVAESSSLPEMIARADEGSAGHRRIIRFLLLVCCTHLAPAACPGTQSRKPPAP